MGEVVVTGGGGFIASHLIDRLLSDGENVTAFDINKELPENLKHHAKNKNFNYVSGSLTDINFLNSIIKKDTTTVYHLASVVGVKNYCTNPLGVIDVNVFGTRNLIEKAIKENVKILFTSTSEIYGKNPAVPWKEDSDRVLGSTNIDRWVYSTTKSLCEHMLNAVHKCYGLPTVIVRYFNIYGPRQAPYFIIPANIHRVLNGKNPVVYDTGAQTRCFTFVSDAIEGTINAVKTKRADGETFNIGSSRENTMTEAVNEILKLSGKVDELSIEYKDTKDLYGSSYEDLDRRMPDTKKAKEFFEWEAKTSLNEGVRRTIEWVRENTQWLRAELPKEIG